MISMAGDPPLNLTMPARGGVHLSPWLMAMIRNDKHTYGRSSLGAFTQYKVLGAPCMHEGHVAHLLVL